MSTTLKNKVGIDTATTPGASELVTNIPNISTGMLAELATTAQVATTEALTALNVLNMVKAEQYKFFRSDMLCELAKRANFQEVADRTSPPITGENQTTLTTTANAWYGVEITLPVSRYQELYIHSLYVRTIAETTTIARLYDTATGDQLGDDIDVTLGRSARVDLEIGTELSDFQNKKILLAVLIPAGTTLESFYAPIATRYTCQELFSFWEGVTPIETSMAAVSTRYIAADYEIRFSLDRVITHFAERLKRAFLMYCAADILDRVTKSQKASIYTQINRIELKENQIETAQVAKYELAGALRTIHPQLLEERLILKSNPDDQPGYYVADIF